MHLQNLSKAQLFSIPEIQDMFMNPVLSEWKEISWEILGGNPLKFVRMAKKLIYKDDKQKELVDYLSETIYDAMRIKMRAISANPDMEVIIQKVKDGGGVTIESTLQGLHRNSPDKVLREVEVDGKPCLAPTSNAMGIVIYHGLSKRPSKEELRSLFIKH